MSLTAGLLRTASPSLRTRRPAFPICGGAFPEFPRNISRAQAELSAEPGNGCETTVPLNRISASSSLQKPSPPFRGEREGPRSGRVRWAVPRTGLSAPLTLPSPPGQRGERINKRRLPDISLTNVRRDGPRIFPGQPYPARTVGLKAGIHTGAAVAFCDRRASMDRGNNVAAVSPDCPSRGRASDKPRFRRRRSLGQRIALSACRNARRAAGRATNNRDRD